MFAWHFAFATSREAFDRILTSAAIQIAENTYLQGNTITLDPPAAALGSLSLNDFVFYKVVDGRGIVVAGNSSLPQAGTEQDIQKSVMVENGYFQDRLVRIASIGKRFIINGKAQWAQITIAQTTNERDKLTYFIVIKAFIIIIIMGLLTIIMSYIALSYALSPLIKIGNEIQNRQAEDIHPIQSDVPREVKPLIQAFNDYFQKLSVHMAFMQRFIADAAHQIKTPLTTLDASMERLLRKKPPAEFYEDLNEMRFKMKTLSRLCQQMLGKAMVAHRSQLQSFSECDLIILVKSVFAQSVPFTFEREVTTAVYHVGLKELKILCDPITLAEAVSNLIDNALKHGAYSRLIVEVVYDDEGASITIADDGKGIDAKDYERLCRPFQKGQNNLANTGLGLSIVKNVVEAHHARLEFGFDKNMFCISIRGLKILALKTA